MCLNLIPLLENEMENERRKEWMRKKRDNVRWTAVSVSCVFLRSLCSKLSTTAPPRVDVCAQSRSGKTFQISFQVGPFFSLRSSLSTSTELVRPAAKCGERPPGMGLSNVASGRRSPFYLAMGFSFLGFLSRPPRSTRCRFSRVFRISTTRAGCPPIHIFSTFFPLSPSLPPSRASRALESDR